MNLRHETVFIETSGAGAGLLAPGRIQRALALAAGLNSDDIGTITPMGRGRAAVEIAMQRALSLATPLALPIREAGRPALLYVRRESDPDAEQRTTVHIAWEDGVAPTPGALIKVLAHATEGRISEGDVGAAYQGPRSLDVCLSEGARALLDLPLELVDGAGRTLRLSEGGGKKKP